MDVCQYQRPLLPHTAPTQLTQRRVDGQRHTGHWWRRLRGLHIKGFSQIFYSFDGGIYWRPVSTYSLPANFESNNAFTMATDSHDNVWMFCGGNGCVWKGHSTNTSESNPSAITR